MTASTINPGNFTITAPGDLEVVMTRVFDAPRHLVFHAFTKPELVKRWLLGPDGWSMPICEIDLKVGGRYRYQWRRDKDGQTMATGGVFREIVAGERIVHTEKFEEPWFEGEAVVTTRFDERDGKTTVSMTILYEKREIRDGVLKSGMERGVAKSYERLADILEEQVNAKA